jgi:hypothetical protein
MTLPVISAAGDDISDVAVVQEGRKCFIFQRGLTDTLRRTASPLYPAVRSHGKALDQATTAVAVISGGQAQRDATDAKSILPARDAQASTIIT